MWKQNTPIGHEVFERPRISVEIFDIGIRLNPEAFDKHPNSSRSLSEAA